MKNTIAIISTFKEAFLTFMIFDTVLECIEELKFSKNQVKCDCKRDVEKIDNKDKKIYRKVENIEEKYSNLKK